MIFKYKHHFSTFLLLLSVFVIQLLFISANSSAQSITWQRVYDGGRNTDDLSYSCCVADGTNFFAVGFADEPIPYFYVLKLNQYGDTLWSKKFGAGGKAYSVASSGDGGCVFTGDWGQNFAIKLNSSGDTVWQRFYNGNRGYDIQRTIDNGYVICGEDLSGGRFGSFLCKIDSNGNQQWYRNFSANSAIDFKAVEILQDGYIICGDRYDTVSNAYQASITRTNSSGNELWSRIYRLSADYSSISKIKHVNTGFIVAGSRYPITGVDSTRVFLAKLDAGGDTIKTFTLSTTKNETQPIDLLKVNENKLFLSFFHTPFETRIKSLDSNLNFVNQTILKPNINMILISSLMLAPLSSTGDLIVVGGTDYKIFSWIDTYVARLDSNITQLPPIGIKLVSTSIPFEYSLSQNFPNPFNPITKIPFALSKNAFTELKIFDVLGREMEILISDELKPGLYIVEFNGSNYASGVYFYRMTVDGKIVDSKRMVLKK